MVPEGTGGPRERSKWVLFTSVQGSAQRHSTLNDRETCPCVSLVVGAVKNLSGINTPWQVDYPNPPLASALVAVTAPGVPEAGKRSPQERVRAMARLILPQHGQVVAEDSETAATTFC